MDNSLYESQLGNMWCACFANLVGGAGWATINSMVDNPLYEGSLLAIFVTSISEIEATILFPFSRLHFAFPADIQGLMME